MLRSPYLIIAVLLCQMGCTAQKKEKTPEVPKEKQSLTFQKTHVWDVFISEGVTVGDVNNDGAIDILAGAYWFEAPEWQPHEIQPPKAYDYTKGYSEAFLSYTLDVNEDGWVDHIIYGFPGKNVSWYENPKGQEVHWTEHVIDSNACNESPFFGDLDGNGHKDLVFGNENTGIMKWFEHTINDGVVNWESRDISKPNSPGTPKYSHGLGVGDINGDGRNDVIIREGWWEAPENKDEQPWAFHETDLGQQCSQMYAYDFDKDGDNDVISAAAHNYGMWWHEQVKGEGGEPKFVHHLIDSTFSQTHALVLIDMNKDGLPDLVTGKRYFAHQGKDPGGTEPAVLYWFELQRDKNNQPTWTRYLIDDNSGIGLNTVVQDMNGDGKLDIVIANKKGVFIFKQE